MCRSAVRPSRLRVEINPHKPKQWSPCRWEIKIWFSRENFRRALRNWSCAPSPQSIMNNLSRTLSTCEVEKCRVVGNAEPHPRICNSNFSIVTTKERILWKLSKSKAEQITLIRRLENKKGTHVATGAFLSI